MFLFKKKLQNINDKLYNKLFEETNRLNRQLDSNRIDDYYDFISILEQIQNVNNEQMQWKKKQKTINNSTDLAIENYRNKILELDIDSITI